MNSDFLPILQHEFLEKTLHESFVSQTEYVLLHAGGIADYDHEFNRKVINNLSCFRKLHHDLNPWLEKTLNRKTKPTYNFFTEYKENGFCPKHTDRSPCKYTITICLKQSHICPFWIQGTFYAMKENSMLLYSGTDHVHERPMVEYGFSRLVLLHYVDIDYQGVMI